MSSALWWVWWLAAFMAVLAVLSIAVCVQEWMAWRKDNRK